MQYEGLYAVNVQGRRLGIPAKQNDTLGKTIINHGTNTGFVE